MAARLRIEKRPIGKGRSYAVSAKELERALDVAGISVDVIFVRGCSHGLLSADFWPPHPDAPFDRLYVVGSDVPSSEAEAARRLANDRALPAFAALAKALLELPANSPERQCKHQFACSRDGDLWCSNP